MHAKPQRHLHSVCSSTLFARLVRNNMWVVPTLVVHRANALDSATRHDPRLRYMPESVRRSWEAIQAAITSRETVASFTRGQ